MYKLILTLCILLSTMVPVSTFSEGTLDYKIITNNKIMLSEKELECLSKAVYNEAGVLGERGMKAVGHVIINRTKSEQFPKGICEVIKEKHGGMCQFTWVCTKHTPKREGDSWEKAQEVSKVVPNEDDFTQGALFFHTVAHKPRRQQYAMLIGNTIFYR